MPYVEDPPVAPVPPEDRPPGESTLALLRRHSGAALGIAVVLAATVGGFAYVGGFLTPDRLGADKIANALEATGGGAHAGFRRAHAKGICIAGTFTGSAAARGLSSASVFDGRPVPVTGRFAEATPDPYAKDPMVGVRSMALRLQPVGGDEWRMAINDTPGLHVSTPEAFYENALASVPDPKTGKPDPAKVTAYLAKHPESAAFLARMKAKPLASGFANDSYNSVDGFLFVAPDGTQRLVRWTMQAEAPFATLTPATRAGRSANYMFEDLLARATTGPLKWRLVATLAQPGDPNRAAEVWPENRPKVDLGALVIDHVESEATGNCRDINFDPLVLPAGMLPSDDPIPFARSAVYATSFRRRTREHTPPSAVANQSAGTRP
ncbi:catalase family peroxidase [Sphingomonas sp. UYP23]